MQKKATRLGKSLTVLLLVFALVAQYCVPMASAAFIDLALDSYSAGPSSGSTSVAVAASGTNWNVSTNASWLSASKSGNNVNVSWKANSTGSTRTGTVTVSINSMSDSMTVTQTSHSLTISPSSKTVSATSGSFTVSVSSTNGTPSVSSNASWLTTSNISSTGFTVKYTANTGAQRTGTITVSTAGITKKLTVTQNGAISISPTSKSVTAASGSFSVTVTNASSTPTVSSSVTWLTTSNVTATGFTVKHTANTGSQRSGTITVTSSGVSRKLTVTQAANSISISKTELAFPPAGGSLTNTISSSSGTACTVMDAPVWITWTKSGNTFTFTASNIGSSSARDGIVTIKSGTVTNVFGVSQNKHTLSVSPASKSVGAAAGSFSVTVSSTNGAPTVTPSVSWLSADSVSATGFTAKYSTNGGTQRSGTFTVTTAGITKIVTVTQAANAITIGTASLSFPAGGGSLTNTISSSSGTSCTVMDAPDWISYTKSGNTFTFTATNNTTGAERDATVTIKSGTVTSVFGVTQSAHTLTVTPSTKSVPASSGSFSVTVSSTNGTPSLSSNASWLTSSGASSTGFTVHYTANTTTSSRTGTITVSTGGVSKTVKVTQAKNEISISSVELAFPPAGGSLTNTITASCGNTCIVDICPDWITWSNNGGTFTFTASNIGSGAARDDTVTVKCGSASSVFMVSQTAHSFSVSPTSKSVPASSGSFSVTVNSTNGAPTVTPSDSWLSATDVSATGFTAKYSANSGTQRSGSFTVTTAGITKTISVTQDANAITISNTTLSFPAGGGSLTNTISSSSGTACTVMDAPDWITWSKTGSTFSFTASNNTTGAPRDAIVTVKSGTVTNVFGVSQSAHTLTVSPETKTVPSFNGSFEVSVSSSNGTPTVSSDVSWLSAENLSETGFTAKYAPNSGVQRVGNLSVSTGGITRTVRVTQQANSITVSQSELVFPPAGGSLTNTISSSSGTACTVMDAPDWITWTKSGNTFTFTATNIGPGEARDGIVTVKSGTVTNVFGVSQGAHTLTVSPETKTVPSSNGSFEVRVSSSNGTPTVSSDVSWLSAENVSETGFTAKYATNSGVQRIGSLSISTGIITKTITVTQKANTITISQSELVFPPAGGSLTNTISSSSGTACTVMDAPDWITWTKSGNTFTFTATNIGPGAARDGIVTVKSGTVTNVFGVSQSAHTLTVSPETKTVPSSNGSFEVSVSSSNGTPTVSSDVSWLSAENVSETGFTARYATNSGVQRVGILSVSTGGITKTVTVTQQANSITVSQSELVFPPVGGSLTNTISSSSGTSCTVTDAPDWITWTKSGSTFTFTATNIGPSAARDGIVTVKSGTVTNVFGVSQSAHTLTVYPATKSVNAASGSFRASLSSTNGAPQVSSSATWLKAANVSSTGFTVNYSTNTGTSRSATLTVTTAGLTKTLTVTQAANEIAFSESALEFAPTGGSKTITATSSSGAKCYVSVAPDWISHSESGNSLTLTASNNLGGDSREGTVMVQSGSIKQTIFVSQNNYIAQKGFTVFKNVGTNGNDTWRLCTTAYASYNGETYHADASGYISIAYYGGTVSFGAQGFVGTTYSQKQIETQSQVHLYPESNEPEIIGVWIGSADALTQTVAIEFGTTSSIRPEIAWNGCTPTEIKLVQPGSAITIPKGESSLKLSDYFDLTEPVSIKITKPDGKALTKTLNLCLDYTAPDWLDNLSFGFNDGVSYGISQDGLGDITFGVDLPTIPISAKVEKGKIYVALGKTLSTEGNSIKDYVSGIKEMIDNIDSFGSPSLGGQNADFGIPVTMSAGGFMEGFFNKNGDIIVVSSGFFVQGSGSYSHSQQFMVGPVPLFLEAQIEGRLGAQLQLALGRGWAGATGEIQMGATVSVGVGIGLADVLAVSGGLKGSIDFIVGYTSSSINKFLITLGLKGYVKATALIFEYEWEIDIAEKTWNCLGKSSGVDPETLCAEAMTEALTDPAHYRLPSLDYLRAGSSFRDGRTPSSFLTNAYQNAAPQLLIYPNGTKLAIWVGYDKTRSGCNGLCLFASYYEDGAWSLPFQVEDDGTMDCTPTAALIGDAAVVAWVNADRAIPDNVTMEELAGCVSISLAVFDPQTRSFAAEKISQCDGILDMAPTIGGRVVKGDEIQLEVAVAWVHSTDNAWFGNRNGNQVLLRSGSLQTPEKPEPDSPNLVFVPDQDTPTVAVDGRNLINSLSVYYDGETPHVFYSMDTDGDLATANDLVLFADMEQLAADGAASGAQVVNGRRYWYENGSLLCDGAVIVSGIDSDRYQVLDKYGLRAILFLKGDGLYATINAVLYDEASSAWGQPKVISGGGHGIASYSAAVGDHGIELLVNELTVNAARDGNESYGEAELSIYGLALETDLSVTDIRYDAKSYAVDCDMSAELSLTNSGLTAINRVLVTVLGEDSQELSSKEYNLRLLPGDSTIFACNYLVPEYRPDMVVTYRVTPVGQTDANPNDNSVTAVFTYENLKLNETGWGKTAEGQVYVYSTVVNEGQSAAQTITVSLRSDTADGPVVASTNVSAIERFKGQHVYFPVDYEEGAVYFITIDNARDDNSADDSDFTVLLEAEQSNVPTEPIETDELRIFSSISVGTDMEVAWTARKTDVASYEKFWIEVVKHAPDGDETYLYGAEQAEALNEGSSSWSCDFKHVFAKEMGVEIEARVYAEDANGQIYRSPAKTTNIRDYLGGRLTATLGFIAQEMGREINTTGSKSNQAEMQNIVVKMKDELEQIKEQVLNAL